MGYGAETTKLTTNFGTADANAENLVPELWSDIITDYLNKKLVFTNVVQDWSDLISGKGDVIHVPKLQEVGAVAGDLGGASETNATFTTLTYDMQGEAEATITIDQHYYTSKVIADILKVQAMPSMMDGYAKALAYGLAKQVDTYMETTISTAMDAVGATETATGAIDVPTIANFSSMFEYVRSIGADPIADGYVFVCNYKVFQNILDPSAGAGLFMARHDVGAGTNSVHTGVVPTLMGVPLIMSGTIGTGANELCAYLLHPQSFGYAMSIKPRVQSQYDIDFLATKVVADSLLGIDAINEEFSACLKNPSS